VRVERTILAMARPLRIEYLGIGDHLMARGKQERASFQDDGHRQGFIEALAASLREDGFVDPRLELWPRLVSTADLGNWGV
jgi:hypothetical protein